MQTRFLIVAVLGSSFAFPALCGDTATARATVFLRAAPSLDAEATGVLGKGLGAEIIDSVGEFRRVRTLRDGVEGYLRVRMLDMDAAQSAAEPVTPVPARELGRTAPLPQRSLPFPTPAARARQEWQADVITQSRDELPAAEVTGPQSTVEQYETPLPEPTEGEIVFPQLLDDPQARDGRQILDQLNAVQVEFVNRKPGIHGSGFVEFSGHTAVAERDVLYVRIEERLAIYRNLPLTLGDVRFLQQDITDAYRELGYPLMSVFVPPQEIENGALRVQVNEFSLAGYELSYGDGSGGFGPDNPHWSKDRKIRRQFDSLLDDPILSRDELDKRVKFVSRNPYRSARLVFEPGADLGKTVAKIQLEEKKRWGLNAGYNNHATKSSGEHRYSFGGNRGGLPFADHQLSFNVVLGPKVEEFANYSLVYRIPIGVAQSFTLNGNFSDTASSSIPGVGSASTTLQVSGAWAFPIIERKGWGIKGTSTLFLKQFSRDSIFGGMAVGGADFDAYNFVLSGTLNAKESTATNQLTLTATQSLNDIGGDNSEAAFRQFYNRSSGGPEYIFYALSYARVQQLPFLGQGWAAETQLSWQQAQDELAGSDQFAIGGAQVLRAYASSALAGDGGEYATQFFNFPGITGERLGALGRVIRGLDFSLFAEWGQVRPEAGGSRSLWDYGLQLRLSLPGNASCTGSFAVAGEPVGETMRDDLQSFVGCSVSY